MHKKHLLYLAILIMAFLAACSPQQVEEVMEEANVEEVVEEALRPVTEEELEETVADEAYPAPVSDDLEVESNTDSEEVAEAYPAPEESDEEMAEVVEAEPAVDGALAKLPPLAQPSTTSGPPAGPATGGGAPAASIAAESSGVSLAPAGDVMGSSMLIDPGLLFEGTEFVITGDFPGTQTNLVVVQRFRSQATADLAQTVATQNGFQLPIYQEQLPIDAVQEMSIAEDGSFRGMPFVAFSDDQRITIMDGSVWIDTTDAGDLAPFDPARTFPEDILAELAEARIASLGLEIEYELDVQSFGNVLVHPKVNGLVVNQPIIGLYFDYNEANELFIRSMFMDLYSETAGMGEYPLLSAEDAWSNLIPGLSSGKVQWRIDSGAFPTLPPIDDVESDIVQPLTWFVEAGSAETRNLYGWPTVFNPVADDSQPMIFVNGTLIQAPAEAGMLIATSPQGVFKMTGSYVDGANGQSTFAAESVTAIPFESQLFLQGDVVRDGDSVYVESPEIGRVQLIAPPADLPDGMTVFVDGYQDGLAEDGTTLLDWQYLSEAIDYSGEGAIGLETLPMPVEGFGFGLDDAALAEITIDSIEMGYGISWPQYSEEVVDFAPIQSDYLIPVWTYSGTAADGTPVQFEIPAVDPAYFQN